jgi:hypothetical protein
MEKPVGYECCGRSSSGFPEETIKITRESTITILRMPAKTTTLRRTPLCPFLVGILSLVLALAAFAEPPSFRAGAHVADISPQRFPVIVNAMFTERTDKVVDPLLAKAR